MKCGAIRDLIGVKIPFDPSTTLFRNKKTKDQKTASYTHYAQCRLLRNPSYPAFYNLLFSPHSHIPSKMGIKDFPRSVKLYSTFGGI